MNSSKINITNLTSSATSTSLISITIACLINLFSNSLSFNIKLNNLLKVFCSIKGESWLHYSSMLIDSQYNELFKLSM